MLSSAVRPERISIAGQYGPAAFEFSDALVSHSKKLALEAINNNSELAFNQLLKRNPQLLNHPLNEMGQTPLILATQYLADQVIKLLIQKNAQIHLCDKSGKSALDYASEDSKLHVCIKEKYSCLFKLRKNIFFLKKTLTPFQQEILTLCYNASLNFDAQPEKVLDLYCTVNSVVQIVKQYADKTELLARLKLFFATRENFLQGDQHDYCYGFTYANQFCCELAEFLFPAEYAPNVLLAHALNAERDEPWENFANLRLHNWQAINQLPASPRSYFRNAKNQIQLYLPMINQALAELKKGATTLECIWLSFDTKRKNTKDLISAEDLTLLANRSPTLKTLVNYTRRVEAKSTQQGTTFVARFQELFSGMARGDVHNTGADSESGATGHVAVYRFALWWTSLDAKIQKSIKAISIPDNYSLGYYIDIVMDTGFDKKDEPEVYRSSSRFCVNINSQAGNTYMANPQVRARLLAIEKITDWSLPETTLKEWVSTIEWELQHADFQMELPAIFAILNKHLPFKKMLEEQPQLFTYDNLSQIKAILLRLDADLKADFTEAERQFCNRPITTTAELNPLLLYLARQEIRQLTFDTTLDRLKMFALLELLRELMHSNLPFLRTQFVNLHLNHLKHLLHAAINAVSPQIAEALLQLANNDLPMPEHICEAFLKNNVAVLKVMITRHRAVQSDQALLMQIGLETKSWECIEMYFNSVTMSKQSWEKIKPFIISQGCFTATFARHAIQHQDNDYVREYAPRLAFQKFQQLLAQTSHNIDVKTFLALFLRPLPTELLQKKVIEAVLTYMTNRITFQKRGKEYFSFWARYQQKFSATLKITAAKKAILYLLKVTVEFNQAEVDALHDGQLGKILKKYHVVLPQHSGQHNMQELKARAHARSYRRA